MANFIAARVQPIIYLNVPKAGCTSFKNWIYFLDNGSYPKDPLEIHNIQSEELITYQNRRCEIIQRFHTSFVFTFVRHPLKRAFSFYNEKIANVGKYAFPGVRRVIVERYGANFNSRTIEQEKFNFLATLHFIQDTITGRNAHRQDWHWTPQTAVITDALPVRPIDFIGRIETIQEDMAYIQRKIGTDIPLPRFNEGDTPKFSYDEILTDEIVHLGRIIYADDMRNFAYSF